MPKITAKRANRKPAKPHADFPLFPHATRRWAKKVRGRLHYFGPWEDPNGALGKWLEQKDDLLAGRTPRVSGAGVTVADACNRFLTAKQDLRDSGELAPRTFDRLYKTCEFLVGALGRNRLVSDLRQDDFTALRAVMAKRWGPVALGNEIQSVRGAFRFAYESGVVEHPVRFGPGFKKPSAKTLRLARAARGPRLFTPEEVQRALRKATPNTRAMILLGISGGLGNTDLALLPIKAIDVDGRWLDYARTKTGVPRRIPLWPETVAAIKAILASRTNPKDSANAGLLFIGPRGQSYIGNHRGYRVHQEMMRVFKAAKIDGRTPYDLRHTFSTIAEGSRDLPAVQAIMGHAASGSDMAARYRQGVDDERLKAVSEHVRKWLWPAKGNTPNPINV
jgi:integrase